VLADAGRGDWILCQVTSQPYGDPRAVQITNESFSSGTLQMASVARPGKLFTGSTALMAREVGALTPTCMTEIVDSVVAILRGREF
jgi:mRNA interferase MazF